MVSTVEISPDELPLDDPIIKGLDGSMLTVEDLLNLSLQRSEVFFDVEKAGQLQKAWTTGDDGPIRAQIDRLGLDIFYRSAAYILFEYRIFKERLSQFSIGRYANIGSGLGLLDLFILRDTDASVTLIDTEESASRDFGYKWRPAAYNRLSQSRAFLEGNGIAAERIETLNPNVDYPQKNAPYDAAISMVACGFHFPINTYQSLFETAVRDGGAVLLDLRRARMDRDLEYLKTLGEVEEVWARPKQSRVLVTREQADA